MQKKQAGTRSAWEGYCMESLSFDAITDYWHGLTPLWEKLKTAEKPIYLYGMGDGAQKIYDAMNRFGIPLTGIFASDEYVRGHSFLGYKVHKLSEVEQLEPDGFIILLAFAAFTDELTEKIKSIAARHTLYAPDTPVAGETLFTAEFLEEHMDDFRKTYALLADDQSKKVLRDVVAFKLTGKIDYLSACQTDTAEISERLIPLKGRAGTLVDLGGYDGDTLRSWLTETQGDFEHIITLEPDAKNFKKMQRKMEGWDLSKVTCVNAAAHSEKTTLTFAVRGGRNSALLGTGGLTGGKTVEVSAECVDGLLEGKPAAFIKMDVEGNEAEALKGAQKTMRLTHPPLLISAYHRSEDLFALPLLTQELAGGGYRYYLRHHQYIPAWETNYYVLALDDPHGK